MASALALLGSAYGSDSDEDDTSSSPVAVTQRTASSAGVVTKQNVEKQSTNNLPVSNLPKPKKRKLPLLEEVPNFDSDESDVDEWLVSSEVAKNGNRTSQVETAGPAPTSLLQGILPPPKNSYETLEDPSPKPEAEVHRKQVEDQTKPSAVALDDGETPTMEILSNLVKTKSNNQKPNIPAGLGITATAMDGPQLGPAMAPPAGQYEELPEVEEYQPTAVYQAEPRTSTTFAPKSKAELRRLERQLHHIGKDGELSQEVYDQVEMTQVNNAQIRADAATYAARAPKQASKNAVHAKLWNNEAGQFISTMRASVTSKRKHHINALAIEAQQLAADKLANQHR